MATERAESLSYVLGVQLSLVGDRNLDSEMARYEANADVQRDYYMDESYPGGSQGTT